MPVFHFTLHAYRSWNADHPKGYIQRRQHGIKPPDERRAAARDSLKKFPPFRFDDADCQFLIDQVSDVVARRAWTLYGATAIATHLHLILGWRTTANENDVQSRLKRAFGFLLAQKHQTRGRPFFSRGGLPERVSNQAHLQYLLNQYLPQHRGPLWRAKMNP